MSYESARRRGRRSTELEEAVLIALTGCTGLTMPDRPFADPRDRQADHGQAQPEHGRAHGGQPGQRAGHPLLPDQRHRHLLPAQAAAAAEDGRRVRRARRCSRGRAEAKVQLLDHRIDVPDGEPRLPGLPRLQPLPVEPAGHHDPVPGRRPVAPVHQRDDVPADPARRGAADHRRRPQLLPPGRREEVGQERLPEQGHQAAARHHLARCAPRSRPTCCCRT